MQITLLLNDELISTETPPAYVALDFLRKRKQLTGSKEGCKEGDCGACMVIVGELVDGKVEYKPMTSCLLPMGELHGKHLVSIEGLYMEELSPIQSAMVDCGGTQCGYCTPGFVVAMTAGLMDSLKPISKESAAYSISGNLCRCTGYRSIKNAGEQAVEKLAPLNHSKNRIEALCQAGALPAYFQNVAEKLQSISAKSNADSSESATIVAGGTDLFVQQGETLPEIPARLINNFPIRPVMECDGVIHVDARTSFEAFARDSIIQAAIPQVLEYNELIASWPIRTRATLGGNICNASPIADITCLLIALNSQLVLETSTGESRTISLKDFYLGYKKLAKKRSEVVTEIQFSKPDENTFVNWEKVSKRKILDIATVNSAAKISVVDGIITDAHLALGGVSATPLYLRETSQRLCGLTLNAENVLAAVENAQSEFQPISDVRGSAVYKRLLARQLLLAHFSTLFPETLNEEEIYATLR